MADKPTLAQRLAAQASDAAELRNVATNPDVVALRVERTRRQVDVLAWTGIVLGLGFTMTNVQAFAAAGAERGTPSWWAAWALDPMVSLVLIALLRTEQTTARWKVRPGAWVRRARWGCLAATYAMNTWTAWAAGVPAQVLLHSVPVAVVFVATEAITDARESLTEAIRVAADQRDEADLPVVPPVPAARTAYPATGPVFPAAFPSSPARPPFDPPTVEFPPLTMLPGWPLPEPVPAPEPVVVDEPEPVEAGEREHRYAALVAAVKAWLADPEKPRPTVRAVKAEHGVGTDVARRALQEARA